MTKKAMKKMKGKDSVDKGMKLSKAPKEDNEKKKGMSKGKSKPKMKRGC
jgi:hypothetical protein